MAFRYPRYSPNRAAVPERASPTLLSAQALSQLRRNSLSQTVLVESS